MGWDEHSEPRHDETSAHAVCWVALLSRIIGVENRRLELSLQTPGRQLWSNRGSETQPGKNQ